MTYYVLSETHLLCCGSVYVATSLVTAFRSWDFYNDIQIVVLITKWIILLLLVELCCYSSCILCDRRM